MRAILITVCMAATLTAGTMLAALSSPAAATPPESLAAPADAATRSTHEHESSSWQNPLRHARPMIGIQYGFGDVDRDGFGGDLASVGALDFQFGYRVETRFGGEDALLHQSTSFAHVGNLASRLASDLPGPSEVGTDMWRFGFGFGDGYGYRFASDRGRLVLQNSGTLGWYALDLNGEAVGGLSVQDAALLDQFTSRSRYGESWETAVEIGYGDMLALHAGYERAAVFPSFKVWNWMLSTIIDRAVLVGVDLFVDAVEDASPYAAPVVRFVLEGAVQYGFYELRKDKVNWPMDTEPPLAYDTFKLGLTTRF